MSSYFCFINIWYSVPIKNLSLLFSSGNLLFMWSIILENNKCFYYPSALNAVVKDISDKLSNSCTPFVWIKWPTA